MIVLQNVGNTVNLQLDIIGYQFPNYSDNWCLLKIIVQHHNKRFEKIDPALEVSDLYKIYRWFNALAKGCLPFDSVLCFTEPCLELSFISYNNENEIVRISITLNCEIKPDFALDDPDNLIEDWTLYFDLSKNTFESILKNIDQWIQDYPLR
ncbi:hypothetical protein [uncultured Gilliamella sp.]|uniref:WapI family immunity protein n=1 Tax=uncultured Gilliamella sp. TaxID=1193505 RepID=UPI0025CE37A6|nr:hypothetical protein [uncultured Gilliamella sp.]